LEDIKFMLIDGTQKEGTGEGRSFILTEES